MIFVRCRVTAGGRQAGAVCGITRGTSVTQALLRPVDRIRSATHPDVCRIEGATMVDHRSLVATASQVLARQGHNDYVWGHASARAEDDSGVWIKQSGWGLDEITADRVHLVDWTGTVTEGEGPRHIEWAIHTEVMKARPDVGGVVHTHPPFSVAFAASGLSMLPVSHQANFFVPPTPPRFEHTTDLIVNAELGSLVASELSDSNALFLVNHGIVTVGETLQDAVVAAVMLEEACQQQLLTRQFGGWPTWSSEAESRSKRGNIYTPTARARVWDYLVRQL